MKKRRGPHRGRLIPVVFFSFAIGVITGWMLHRPAQPNEEARQAITTLPQEPEPLPPLPTVQPDNEPAPATGTSGSDELPPAIPARAIEAIADLRSRALLLPIEDARIERLQGQFAQTRDRTRTHEAVDILAPKGTPIRAVEAGRIARLFESKAGGTTIYQFDPTGRFCYYYAHLQRYAPHIKEGRAVAAGEIVGYVGTSGNAPENTPHLHFAIFELTPERQWWNGRAIDPYLVFRPPPSAVRGAP